MSKKLTFAQKIKMQKESSEEGSSPEVEKVVEEVEEQPKKKERKPRKKQEKVEVIEVKEEEHKKERKPRKKKEEVLEGGTVETKKPVKEKRPPSAYNLFVKEAYKSKEVQKLTPKERFAKVAELWHKHKGKKSKK